MITIGWRYFALRLHRVVVLVALTVLFVGSASAIEQTLNPVDRDLPPFSLQGVDGKVYEPESLIGKTWLINFWAVWCAPCLEELPALNNAWAQLKEKDVGMLAINIGEDAAEIEQFLTEHNLQIDFPIVIGDEIRTLGNWSGAGLPFTVVVNPAGKVVYEAVGPREWDEPQFVDVVAALNETPLAQSSGSLITPTVTQFQKMSTAVKVGSVAVLLLIVAALMLFIRTLVKRKSTNPV